MVMRSGVHMSKDCVKKDGIIGEGIGVMKDGIILPVTPAVQGSSPPFSEPVPRTAADFTVRGLFSSSNKCIAFTAASTLLCE